MENTTTEPSPGFAGEFSDCPKCSMRIRTSEIAVHVAHAHNIDINAKPSRKRDKPARDDRR
jgi:hypothetical protein